MSKLQSYNTFRAVTLSDTVNIRADGVLTDAIYIGTKGATGTMVGVEENGNTVTFVGLIAGTVYPFKLKRVNSGTTDVSNVVALYEV